MGKVTEDSIAERIESLRLTQAEQAALNKPIDVPDSMILHFEDLDRLTEFSDAEYRFLIDALRKLSETGEIPDLTKYDRAMRNQWDVMQKRLAYDKRHKELAVLNSRLSNIQKARKKK